MIRALLWMPGGDGVPGGHRVQIDQTAAALRDLGVAAEVTFAETAETAGYDLVHGFGLPVTAMRAVRRAGLPIVLSTIYWTRSNYLGVDRNLWRPSAILRRARLGASFTAAAIAGRHPEKLDRYAARWQDQRVQYEMADLLLPNSHAEAERLRSELTVTTPTHIVPNAVDPSRFTGSADDGQKREGVLCVGRIDPHKNQLGLIQAMRHSPHRLTLVGEAHSGHPAYANRVRKALGQRHQLLPGRSHDQLACLYRQHKVHVLPSWYETTGLASLEAALCGCNVVSTSRGFAREYLLNCAWYCDPAYPPSIRAAVNVAYASDYRPELADRILSRFTWRHTAEATASAYEGVLRERGRRTS